MFFSTLASPVTLFCVVLALVTAFFFLYSLVVSISFAMKDESFTGWLILSTVCLVALLCLCTFLGLLFLAS